MTALTAFKLGFYFAAGGLFGVTAATIIVVGLWSLLSYALDGEEHHG